MVFLALFEIAFGTFIGVRMPMFHEGLDEQWHEASDEQRNKIQVQFSCCGFADRTDLPGTNCRGAEWTSGCATVVTAQVAGYKPEMIGIGVMLLFLQLSCTLLSCYLFVSIPTMKQIRTMMLEDVR